MTTTKVPGKPAYEYGRHIGDDGIFKWVTTGSGDNRSTDLEMVLDWYPRVTSYVVRLDSRKKILDARYTLTVGGHEDTINADDLADAAAWKKWPEAIGVHDRTIRDVLAIIVQNEAKRQTPIADAPYWDDDRLVFPSSDLMPRGYCERHDAGELEELKQIAVANPKLALILGFSYGAPYVEPLGRQSFWVCPSGDSSKGKTTALLAAASLHGRATPQGVKRAWNASPNGVNLFCSNLAVMPAFFDEIHMAGFTPATLKKMIHTTCDGADRFTSSRTQKLKENAPWTGVIFSTGNLSVTGWCPQPEIAVRVVEIPAPIVADSETSKRVKAIAKTTYGWWDPVTLENMRQALAVAERKIGLPADGGAEERIVENLALGVAGAWAIGGPAMAEAALGAAHALLAVQVDELQDEGRTPSEKLLEEIRQSIVSRPVKWPTIATYQEWLADPHDPDHQKRPVAGVDILGFHEHGVVKVITKFMDELARGAGLDNARIALRELKGSGALKVGTEQGERLRKRERVSGKRFDVYEVDLDHAERSAVAATPYREAKMTGTTGTTGTDDGETAVQMVFDGWSRLETAEKATGTSATNGTSETSVSAGETGGPGRGPGRGPGPGPGGTVIPLNAQRANQRADFEEQLGNFARMLARSGKFPTMTEQETTAGLRTFSVALGGLSFAGAPARVGQLLFEKLEAQYPGVPILGAPPKVVPVDRDRVVTMFNTLDKDADVAGHKYVVGLDVNAQFLAAAQTVALGTGEPVPVKDWRAGLKRPGYVQLGEDVVVGPGCTLAAGAVLANPMAEYLDQRGTALPVTASYQWPESRRWLALWVKHVRTARQDLIMRDDLASKMALTGVKAMYAAFLGGWLNSGENRNNYNTTHTLRPDWMHAIHSAARANALRGLNKSNIAPFATLADAAYFLTNDPIDPRGVPMRCTSCEKARTACDHFQPGKWKAHRIGRTADTATITVNKRLVNTTLAEQVAAGSLGKVSQVVRNLTEQYRGVEIA